VDVLKLRGSAERTGTVVSCGLTLYLLKQEMVHWGCEVRRTSGRGRGLVKLCVDLHLSGKWSQETSVDVQDLVHSYFCTCCLCGIL